MPKPKSVIHVTTVHPWFDNRIYRKIVMSLVTAKYPLTYVAPLGKDSVDACAAPAYWLMAGTGVFVRIKRMIQALLFCMKQEKSIIHFHDPEFIPAALLLHVMGHKLVYDVHEDNVLGIAQKHYLRSWQKNVFPHIIKIIECIAARFFKIVIAEKAYRYRFPDSCEVLNYPINESSEAYIPASTPNKGINLIYTGNVSEDRGALLIVEILKKLPEATLHIIGRCSDDIRQKMEDSAGPAKDRMLFAVDPVGIPFDIIEAKYREQKWTAGLAVFPDTPHYREKELTKLFEYMQHGIPIVCSDFPVWKNLVEGNGTGICVSPEQIDDAVNAIKKIYESVGRYQSFSNSGRKAVTQNLSWNSQLNNLKKLYASLGLEGQQ